MTGRRFRLTTLGPLFVAVILIASFVAVMLIGLREGVEITRQRSINNNRTTLAVAARLLFPPLNNRDEDEVRRILSELTEGETSIAYAGVRDPLGWVVAEVGTGWTPEERTGHDLAAQAFLTQDIVSREIQGYLVLYGPITAGPRRIGTVCIAFDQTALQAEVESMQKTMILLAAALTGIAVLAVAVLARYATSPLRALTVAADEIGRGNLEAPIPIRGAQETAALGVSLERMRTDLQELYRNLERQVTNLERRARYLEATATVARDAASVLDPQELFSRVARLVSEQLGFYHTGIFTLDLTGEWVVLQAASSEGGQRMAERGYRLRVGEESIVGDVAERGVPRIALDTGPDAVHLGTPDLPNTRSEAILPLRARGEIIGVLDVQSVEPEAFDREDVAVLQTLADQVALAISNARLFQQTQESMEAQRRAYGEISRQAWAEALHGQELGYYCDASGLIPLAESAGLQDEDSPALSIPITVREQAIGTIKARKPEGRSDWSDEEVALLKEWATQLGTALESARLYQDTQYRASRERLIGEITDKMRRAVDLESLLQSALQQTAAAMGAASAFVQLSVPPEQPEEPDWRLDEWTLDELLKAE